MSSVRSHELSESNAPLPLLAAVIGFPHATNACFGDGGHAEKSRIDIKVLRTELDNSGGTCPFAEFGTEVEHTLTNRKRTALAVFFRGLRVTFEI